MKLADWIQPDEPSGDIIPKKASALSTQFSSSSNWKITFQPGLYEVLLYCFAAKTASRSTIKLRRSLIPFSVLLIVALLEFIFILFGKIDLVSPPVPQDGIARIQEIVVDEATGVASMKISVLIYNVTGLPWPFGCGKLSRQIDENGKQILIACNRSAAVRNIGNILAHLMSKTPMSSPGGRSLTLGNEYNDVIRLIVTG